MLNAIIINSSPKTSYHMYCLWFSECLLYRPWYDLVPEYFCVPVNKYAVYNRLAPLSLSLSVYECVCVCPSYPFSLFLPPLSLFLFDYHTNTCFLLFFFLLFFIYRTFDERWTSNQRAYTLIRLTHSSVVAFVSRTAACHSHMEQNRFGAVFYYCVN